MFKTLEPKTQPSAVARAASEAAYSVVSKARHIKDQKAFLSAVAGLIDALTISQKKAQ